VVRALRRWLCADSLVEVLPLLHQESEGETDHRRITRSRAIKLVYSLGTVGGLPGRAEGAADWAVRLARREGDLQREIDAIETSDSHKERQGLGDKKDLLRDLRAMRPALESLVGVAQVELKTASLEELWTALRGFLCTWVSLPPVEPPVLPLLEARVGALVRGRLPEMGGTRALELIGETLETLRVPAGRFGDPAVYVGTLDGAADLSFRAVRVVGLTEGTLPVVPGEDPVLPEGHREAPGLEAIEGSGDRALAGLHALHRVVRNCTGKVVLSSPRRGVDGTERAPSSVVIEAAAALGRGVGSPEVNGTIPDSGVLERQYFAPAREGRRHARLERPLDEASWQDRSASENPARPSRWADAPSLDLARLEALRADGVVPGLDGCVGNALPLDKLGGVTPGRGTSASRLATMLKCPHRFLFENVLGWREPASEPALREIDTLPYGGLAHRVIEVFSEKHGNAFAHRERSLAEWQTVADQIACAELTLRLESYPLVGTAVREKELIRLRRDIHVFLECEWDGGRPHEYVGAEIAFGYPDPYRLQSVDPPLYIHGFIDRVERTMAAALVRDFKTGKSHPRVGKEEGPTHTLDLQIGLYGILCLEHADRWDLPHRVEASYVYPDAAGQFERGFSKDFDLLREETLRWLRIGASLLHERDFPRTPRADEDCRYCPFKPVCGPARGERAKQFLAGASGALAEFQTLKTPEGEES
jgi:hypothetical protein